MNNTVTYACTALKGTNKKGILKPDENGYYELVLGALNFYNSVRAFYPLEPAKKLFEESSSLMRRINNGALRGELGHPKKLPGMSMRDYISRILEIHEENVCCHIKEVRLDNESVKDDSGRPIMAIIGKVKPSGPKGQSLKESLENPDEAVCFSIRSLTHDIMVNGVLQKHLKTIVCWDYVNEPGISVATKWNAPSLEGVNLQEDLLIQENTMSAVAEQRKISGVSLESGGLDIEEVIEDLGWNNKSPEVPPSSKW